MLGGCFKVFWVRAREGEAGRQGAIREGGETKGQGHGIRNRGKECSHIGRTELVCCGYVHSAVSMCTAQ